MSFFQNSKQEAWRVFNYFWYQEGKCSAQVSERSDFPLASLSNLISRNGVCLSLSAVFFTSCKHIRSKHVADHRKQYSWAQSEDFPLVLRFICLWFLLLYNNSLLNSIHDSTIQMLMEAGRAEGWRPAASSALAALTLGSSFVNQACRDTVVLAYGPLHKYRCTQRWPINSQLRQV